MKTIMEQFIKYKFLLLVIFFAFLSVFPLFHSGLPPTHDGEYHVIRFWQFDKVFREGIFYPRWAPDLNFGFGTPLFNYVYPFPNFVSSLFHLFGISFIDSFKLNLILAIILAGIFSYKWLQIFFGKLGATVGAIFYLFSPYMLVDVYVRGSVGEVWALAFFPALLWVITEFIYNNRKQFLSVSIIFLALIIFSHNILALMFFPLFVLYSIILIYLSNHKKMFAKNFLLLIILGLGLSSIFWLPAIYETKYVVGLQIYDFKTNFPDLYQLIFPSWGSGIFGDLRNGMSVQIGIANLLIVLFSFLVLFKLIKKKDNKKILVGFFLLSFFIVLFLMQSVSLVLWNKIPLMNYFQFPWRFLSLIILICSFLSASLLDVFKSKIFALFLIVFSVLLTYNYAHPAYYLERKDVYYQTRPNFIDGTNSIGNSFNTLWFNADKARINSKITKNKDIIINKSVVKSTVYEFEINALKPSILTLNTAYFPGWEAKIDGKVINVEKDSKGLIYFSVPKGKHLIRVGLSDTLIRKVATLITFFSVILVITLFVKTWYIKYK